MEGRLGRLLGKIMHQNSSDEQHLSETTLGEIKTKDLLLREGIVEELTRQGRVITTWRGSYQDKQGNWIDEALMVIPPPGTIFGDRIWVCEGGGAVFFNTRGEEIAMAELIGVEPSRGEILTQKRDDTLRALGHEGPVYQEVDDEDVHGSPYDKPYLDPIQA